MTDTVEERQKLLLAQRETGQQLLVKPELMDQLRALATHNDIDVHQLGNDMLQAAMMLVQNGTATRGHEHDG